jgi:hypothetical protein
MLTIKCDNVPRFTLDWSDLSNKEKGEFNYFDLAKGEQHDTTFVRYKGVVYDLNEFQLVSKNAPPEMQKFDGYQSDSFFSGVLIRFVDPSTCDMVVAATYYN